ncbi:uncharacterized protein PGTG_20777 [Puccinia graminis f. sp. tritici CRL 75-36-700-3]|uniref:Uncharacterized protein n=1 Tax=Puccinia graminis f. sp. tritici (strain CRL 75-36-700-3 / race SCCL) TaxID=418459 RepID=H6QP66_PUCGT|nr:uncharacterized protein PGTG_20777 [Puccinia graminis f. sp. tritici CRL 75-36-700-3]EHS63196.1 hypothetical protein PGTG_20777 [Puccinia graminis f. sp. tritici CRL 75-36-700-3]
MHYSLALVIMILCSAQSWAKIRNPCDSQHFMSTCEGPNQQQHLEFIRFRQANEARIAMVQPFRVQLQAKFNHHPESIAQRLEECS